MALEASHIRFALAVQHLYKIDNLEAYISGTVYPDSRYISKIDRHYTHDPNLVKNCSKDFLAGWSVHLEYDLLQKDLFKKIFLHYKFEINTHEETWINYTAAKIIQDMNDWNSLKDSDLSLLTHIETPNNELPKTIQKYNQVVIDTYQLKEKLTVNDYYEFWIKLGVKKEKLNELKNKTEELLNNSEFCKKIQNCFLKAVKNYKPNIYLNM